MNVKIALTGLLGMLMMPLPCQADVKSDFVHPPLKFRSRPLWFWNNTNVNHEEYRVLILPGHKTIRYKWSIMQKIFQLPLEFARGFGILAAGLGVSLTTSAASESFPDFQTLAGSAQQVWLLPRQPEFIFSMYGAPGELARLRQLVEIMRAQKLGNGFDPGPGLSSNAKLVFDYLATVGWPVICYSGGEMQIKGGRAVLGSAYEAVLAAMDRAGLFTAVQLGEWGYY